jgi:hypothetical protein
MPIRDNATNTIHTGCAECEAPLDLSVARVQDDLTGAIYCDAMCHHTAFYGIRPPITMGEEAALDRARAWMRANR